MIPIQEGTVTKSALANPTKNLAGGSRSQREKSGFQILLGSNPNGGKSGGATTKADLKVTSDQTSISASKQLANQPKRKLTSLVSSSQTSSVQLGLTSSKSTATQSLKQVNQVQGKVRQD